MSRPTRPRVTVVVPALNEADNLAAVLPTLPMWHEVVVVDGGSTDGTPDIVRRVRPSAVVVQQTRRGKGNALVCGFAAATGDVIVMFDADGSADAGEIPHFVQALVEGADFAKGSRARPGGGSSDITRVREFGNRCLTAATNLMFRTRFTDLCYGYNAFWRDVLPRLELPDPGLPGSCAAWGDGFEIETVLNCRAASARLRITEVPSLEGSRLYGASNLHAVRDGVRVARTLLVELRRSQTVTRLRDALPDNVIDLRAGRLRRASTPVRALARAASR